MESQTLPFAKMHGCGNDYVVVDARRCVVDDVAGLARAVADRRIGVGSDGLLLAEASSRADLRMRMFNPDGTEAEMCGNGLRCLARYAVERGLVERCEAFVVETGAGLLPVSFPRGLDETGIVSIDMGLPRLEREEIPMRGEPGRVVEEPLEVTGATLAVTAVSMGNPHAVFFVPDVEQVALAEIGPLVERNEAFPQRTNVEFVEVLDRDTLRQRTWERGVGETLACGTGACAAAVAGALTGRTRRAVTVKLRGGDLAVGWDGDGHVHMTGPAVEVFAGRWPLV